MLWAEDDNETLELINQLTPDNITMEHIIARNAIMQNSHLCYKKAFRN